MKSILVKIFVIYCHVCSIALAQDLSHLPGAFADLNLGVRPAALGGAYTAISNDGNALLYNPAAAAFTPLVALTATSTKLYNIVPATYLGVHYPIARYSIVGGIQQLGDDLLSETSAGVALAMRGDDLFGETIQSIPYLDRMAFSMSLRFLFASFGENEDGGEDRVRGDGQGFAMDFGYFVKWDEMRFGMTVRDALAYFRWHSSARGDYSQNAPRTVKLGVAYVKPKLRLSFDIQPAIYDDIHTRVSSGIEFNMLPWLMLRTGLSQNTGGIFHNKVWGMGFGVYNLKWNQFRLGIQGGYRTDELDQNFKFGLDLFWPPK